MKDKYIFNIDYADGTHEKILDALLKCNSDRYIGYGHDHLTNETVELIKKEIDDPTVSVNFIPGGTHTNLIACKTFLRPYEAVISADIGHINVNECGAVEATGHKVIAVNCEDGKLTPKHIEKIVKKHNSEHMLRPRMVFISNTLENGLVYNKKELTELSEACKENDLYLYLDGARLSQAFASPDCDLTLKDIAKLCDAFYIGGTKNGMLYGEALIISNPRAKRYIRHVMKQSGAVLSKTWVMALQFKVLFEDGLFYELGQISHKRAEQIYDGLSELGVEFFEKFSSNQIFPIFHDSVLEKLNEKYVLQVWEVLPNNRKAVRIATTFNTSEEIVQQLIDDTREILIERLEKTNIRVGNADL